MSRLLNTANLSPACITFAVIFSLAVSAAAAQPSPPRFLEFVAQRLTLEQKRTDPQNKEAVSIDAVCPITSSKLAKRVFAEYGSMFAAEERVRLPMTCIFLTSAAVEKFQLSARSATAYFDGARIDLQTPAMDALLKADTEARFLGMRITPFDGSIASRRTYAETVGLWNSRFFPALDHWVNQGSISIEDAIKARNASTEAQVERIMEWESAGLFFSTNRTRSIFSATAPPGTSQHLSMLAFDVAQYDSNEIRVILNKHGWFQTIAGDAPHFTYLGVPESELPGRGLRSVLDNGRIYWLPDLSGQ